MPEVPPRLFSHPMGEFSSSDGRHLNVHAEYWRLSPEEVPWPTLRVVGARLPGLRPFVGHPAYTAGVFRCQIGAGDPVAYTANRKEQLRFHSDMTLLQQPPAVTVIRCLIPDDGTAPVDGALLLLHVADVLGRLRELGRHDILEFLHAGRLLRLADGSTIQTALIPTLLGDAPLRIFDRIGWQFAALEAALLAEFLELCHSFEDLCTRIAPERDTLLAFSNRHFLHSRAPCTSEVRLTEICLGDLLHG